MFPRFVSHFTLAFASQEMTLEYRSFIEDRIRKHKDLFCVIVKDLEFANFAALLKQLEASSGTRTRTGDKHLTPKDSVSRLGRFYHKPTHPQAYARADSPCFLVKLVFTASLDNFVDERWVRLLRSISVAEKQHGQLNLLVKVGHVVPTPALSILLSHHFNVKTAGGHLNYLTAALSRVLRAPLETRYLLGHDINEPTLIDTDEVD
ncbi:hypothetical protein BAUCODRAFT_480718 [Baudoinia panamericana UAMH 10762]|uniref:Uncharacterized protein n=1 Tax=Baudoinia panamericana (strain UAMH 10762) TaxID=717646 RepID=M2LQ90_BAUPA|nr:uncharacterized protein BAUCODRAFT_480718 [Baudoinia panamericana UAMH 10762]EMC96572.1 hypothetical protein BAUCODRAFT_480718 [Baudoinia panamericana UAMH 10762]